jgi:hypothetical protein
MNPPIKPRAITCSSAQAYRLPPHVARMETLINVGAELIRTEVAALGARGPYRLTISHSRGIIVEYFHTAKAALARAAELEELLMSAQGVSRSRVSAKRTHPHRSQKGVAA